ncbi:hypothetical protein AX14_008875 [Amanita brunnescens Koide BX004]|nr:hypothetical protein AX14_008875 [Amanita brunnescens Koide BX004]
MGALQHLSVSLKTTGETGLAISRPPHRLGAHAKPSEQSDEAVLHREFPKGNALKGVRPSHQVMLAPASLSRMNVCAAVKLTAQERREVSTMKGKNATKHSPSPKTALTLPKSMPLSAIWALALFPSSWTIVMLRTPNEVRKCRRMNRMTHQASEARTAIVEGPAVKLALAYSLSEVGERLRAAVYIQYKAEESIYAPTCSATATLPVSVPAVPSTQSMHLQPSDGLTSHTEAMSERCDLNVASKMPETHLIRSQNLEAARRRSNPSSTLARVDGGGPLAGADARTQERSRRHSPAVDEFAHWDPKIPLNKTACQQSCCKAVNDLSKQKGLDMHISLPTVLSTTITPASPLSLLSSVALMPSAPSPAFLSQIPHASQLSFKLGGLLVKSPCKGD